jgi:hypothetical protein
VVAAQVEEEAWEAAAYAESVLTEWYMDNGAESDVVDDHLASATEYAARVPPSETTCRIAGYKAYRLYTSGHSAEVLPLTEAMLAITDEAGLELGQSRLLEWRGIARVDLGDAGGVDDIRQAAEILASHASVSSTLTYINLCEITRALGDFSAADAALSAASSWANRYGDPYHINGVAARLAYHAYHRGDWTAAGRAMSQIQTIRQFEDANLRDVRGRINLAQGDTQAAIDDAEMITRFATTAQNDELLLGGLALQTRIQAAQHRREAARVACDQFLALWQKHNSVIGLVLAFCELAPTLVASGRHDELRESCLLLPDACRWREPLLLTADQQYAKAAEAYERLGSHPLAADTHLLAAQHAAADGRTSAAAHHANAVLAFAAKAGATLYQDEAEQFTAASA